MQFLGCRCAPNAWAIITNTETEEPHGSFAAIVYDRWCCNGSGRRLAGAAQAETPKYGGTSELSWSVALASPASTGTRNRPSLSSIRLAPFYSLLIKVNPENPSDPTAFRLRSSASAMCRKPTDGGNDLHLPACIKNAEVPRRCAAGCPRRRGQPSTTSSSRRRACSPSVVSMYEMVETVSRRPTTTPSSFTLKIRDGSAFVPALANPYNWIYSASPGWLRIPTGTRPTSSAPARSSWARCKLGALVHRRDQVRRLSRRGPSVPRRLQGHSSHSKQSPARSGHPRRPGRH